MAGSRVLMQVLDLCRVMILARLLSPEDFGVFGIVMVALITLETFSQTGLTASLVQRRGVPDGYLNTAWTINVLRGVILAIILWLTAPFVASLFDEPRALWPIRATSLSAILFGLTNVGMVFFYRDMNFRVQAAYDLAGTVSSLIVGVTLAYTLRSPWALVWANIAAALVRCTASYALQSYRPRFELKKKEALEMATFGRWMLGQSIFIYLWQQSVPIFIAKMLGTSALGIYSVSYRIANAVPAQINFVSSWVLFPAYSKIQDDTHRSRSAFSTQLGLILSLLLPATVFMIMTAPEIVDILLGSGGQWSIAGEIVQILLVTAFILSVVETSTPIFLATGRPDLEMWKNLLSVVVLAAVLLPFTMALGLQGACIAATTGAVASLAVWQMVRRVVGLTWRKLFLSAVPGCILALGAALSVAISRLIIPGGTFFLVLAIFLALIVYLVSVILLFRLFNVGPYPIFQDIVTVMRSLFPAMAR